MGCISSLLGPDTSYYKGKTAEKHMRKQKAAQKGENLK